METLQTYYNNATNNFQSIRVQLGRRGYPKLTLGNYVIDYVPFIRNDNGQNEIDLLNVNIFKNLNIQSGIFVYQLQNILNSLYEGLIDTVGIYKDINHILNLVNIIADPENSRSNIKNMCIDFYKRGGDTIESIDQSYGNAFLPFVVDPNLNAARELPTFISTQTPRIACINYLKYLFSLQFPDKTSVIFSNNISKNTWYDGLNIIWNYVYRNNLPEITNNDDIELYTRILDTFKTIYQDDTNSFLVFVAGVLSVNAMHNISDFMAVAKEVGYTEQQIQIKRTLDGKGCKFNPVDFDLVSNNFEEFMNHLFTMRQKSLVENPRVRCVIADIKINDFITLRPYTPQRVKRTLTEEEEPDSKRTKRDLSTLSSSPPLRRVGSYRVFKLPTPIAKDNKSFDTSYNKLCTDFSLLDLNCDESCIEFESNNDLLFLNNFFNQYNITSETLIQKDSSAFVNEKMITIRGPYIDIGIDKTRATVVKFNELLVSNIQTTLLTNMINNYQNNALNLTLSKIATKTNIDENLELNINVINNIINAHNNLKTFMSSIKGTRYDRIDINSLLDNETINIKLYNRNYTDGPFQMSILNRDINDRLCTNYFIVIPYYIHGKLYKRDLFYTPQIISMLNENIHAFNVNINNNNRTIRFTQDNIRRNVSQWIFYIKQMFMDIGYNTNPNLFSVLYDTENDLTIDLDDDLIKGSVLTVFYIGQTFSNNVPRSFSTRELKENILPLSLDPYDFIKLAIDQYINRIFENSRNNYYIQQSYLLREVLLPKKFVSINTLNNSIVLSTPLANQTLEMTILKIISYINPELTYTFSVM